ncbi:unnamed protein product [Vitrella brassicaformis CCMP3155]|uniref:Uncharacterized protein n=1 Tax=Vitrella brassicaformis (strain CCMP3155) TaxID=1169540 RepID=A0A0G4ES58_VITBC|nr:unnamed protein product [Vitrella brassicaformis CCMP3155]|eukprot:CEM00404.1 unnamed protein product [Vitrella brassicaformis CCMP3155]
MDLEQVRKMDGRMDEWVGAERPLGKQDMNLVRALQCLFSWACLGAFIPHLQNHIRRSPAGQLLSFIDKTFRSIHKGTRTAVEHRRRGSSALPRRWNEKRRAPVTDVLPQCIWPAYNRTVARAALNAGNTQTVHDEDVCPRRAMTYLFFSDRPIASPAKSPITQDAPCDHHSDPEEPIPAMRPRPLQRRRHPHAVRRQTDPLQLRIGRVVFEQIGGFVKRSNTAASGQQQHDEHDLLMEEGGGLNKTLPNDTSVESVIGGLATLLRKHQGEESPHHDHLDEEIPTAKGWVSVPMCSTALHLSRELIFYILSVVVVAGVITAGIFYAVGRQQRGWDRGGGRVTRPPEAAAAAIATRQRRGQPDVPFGHLARHIVKLETQLKEQEKQAEEMHRRSLEPYRKTLSVREQQIRELTELCFKQTEEIHSEKAKYETQIDRLHAELEQQKKNYDSILEFAVHSLRVGSEASDRAAAALATSAPSAAYGTYHYHQHQHGSGVFPAPAYTQTAACVRPYRIVYRSGNPEPNDGPAVHRLSRDNHVCIFSHFHPWEFSRMRSAIGPAFEIDAAQPYTQLTLDCTDQSARRMWENLSCDAAYQWGHRARNIKELTVRHPHDDLQWCVPAWVSLVEGHAHGHLSDQQHQASDEASSTVAPPPLSQPPSHATLQTIRFEGVKCGRSRGRNDWYERRPPPPSSPVHLPALTTVTNIPARSAWARAGRGWVTPNVTTLTFEGRFVGEVEYDGAREWIGGCDRLEKLEYDTEGYNVQEGNERLLTAMPEGQGLASLRSLGRVRMADDIGFYSRWDVAEVDEFRQLLVRRGCVRSLQEMELDVGEYLEDTAEMRQLIENAAKLTDAVMHPDARRQPIMPCTREDGQIDLQLVAWSRQHPSPTLQKLVNDFADGADAVVFDERPRASSAHPMIPPTFPHSTTLILPESFLAHEQVGRAVEVAMRMPRLKRIVCDEHRAAMAFLKALHAAAPEKKLKYLTLRQDVDSIVNATSAECGDWSRTWIEHLNKLPSIRSAMILVQGVLLDDSRFECLYSRLTTLLVTLSKAKDTEDSCVELCCEERLLEPLRERFIGAMALFNLASTTHRLDVSESDTITLEKID